MVYNLSVRLLKHIPQPCGRTEAFQLTYIPQMLAVYIQYKPTYRKMYIPRNLSGGNLSVWNLSGGKLSRGKLSASQHLPRKAV